MLGTLSTFEVDLAKVYLAKVDLAKGEIGQSGSLPIQ